jgi:hypothetical protein
MERFSPDPLFYSVDHKTDKIVATQEELDRIYDAAYRGLKGDALALAAGFMPIDFNRLCQFDTKAADMVLFARAKNEGDVSGSLMKNAINGDTKAATIVLTHLHGWKPAKPENDNSNELRIVIENTLPDPTPEQKAIS